MRTDAAPILIAEDEPSIRGLLQWALEDEDFAVEAVADGAEAIRRLGEGRPALLVLDVMMPRADGYQVAAALRSLHGRQTPVLVLTAAGDAREAARRISAEGCLAKPFELVELIALVHRLLGRSHLADVSWPGATYEDAAAGA